MIRRSHSLRNDRSPILVDISPEKIMEEGTGREIPFFQIPRDISSDNVVDLDSSIVQEGIDDLNEMPDSLFNFDGVTNLFGGWPPEHK